MDPNQKRPKKRNSKQPNPQNFPHNQQNLVQNPSFPQNPHFFPQHSENVVGASQNWPKQTQNLSTAPPNFQFDPSYQVPMQQMGSQSQNYSQYSPLADSGCQGYDQFSTPYRGESTNENEFDVEDGEEEFELDDDDDDDDVFPAQQTFSQLLSQPLSEPLTQPTPQSFPLRKKSWSTVEDNALISVFMNTTTDQITGTNQKIKVVWGKVLKAFEAARAANPLEIAPRNVHMIKSRWGRIAPAILKWAGFYDEALARKRSGQKDEDVLREAHILHERKHGKFIFYEQWKILAKFHKWRSILKATSKNPQGRPANLNVDSVGSGSSGKRRRGADDDAFPNTPESGSPGEGGSSHPEGVKKAKSRLKGKGVAGKAIEAFQSFGEKLALHSEVRGRNAERSAEIELEKLEFQRQKEARKKLQLELEERNLRMKEHRMNWEMLQSLSLKENRLPFEEEMLLNLTECFRNYKLM